MTDPYTPAQWHQILMNAHAALVANPQNARARAALKAAVQAVASQNVDLAKQEATASDGPEPSTAGSAITGYGEGATLGLASKLGNLLPGPSNTAYLAAARTTHPIATFGGDLAGGASLATLLAKSPALAGVSPAAQGVVGGGLMGAGRGAVEAPAGERLAGGIVGGILGAGTGYVAGKVVGKIAPAVSTILKNLRGAPAVSAATAEVPSQAALVAKQLGITVEEAQKGLARQASRGVAARPSVNLQPMLPSLRAAADPLDTPAFARNASPVSPPPNGLLPYYPRGGQVEQALPPTPVQSPPVIGPASPEVIVRSSSYADLMQALKNPAATARLRQAILQEFQRRGIVGSGLLAPAMTP